MKVVLKRPKPIQYPNPAFGHVHWKRSLPFNVNPRGVLVHRVKSVTSHFYNGVFTHNTIEYWCNGGTHSGGIELAAVPPEDRLLCERCEEIAVANCQPPSQQLAGRHVHVGVLKAHRTCCRENDSN